mgnify:FL=1
MRKDVECTFGTLKGRFRILKAGVRMHGVNICDQIWLTCCALHNMLLDKDGLSIEWQDDIGLFDNREDHSNVPFALRRLLSGAEQRNYDSSGMGPGYVDDIDDEQDENEITAQIQCDKETVHDNIYHIDQGEINDVHRIDANMMRDKLIIHFDILFRRHQIHWPQR